LHEGFGILPEANSTVSGSRGEQKGSWLKGQILNSLIMGFQQTAFPIACLPLPKRDRRTAKPPEQKVGVAKICSWFIAEKKR
jgi:hypothetical protein